MIGESDIQQFTSDTWATVLGLDLEPTASVFNPTSDTMTGCVQVTGAWQGAVMLICPVPLAKRVSAVMFGLELDDVTAEHEQDALGELVNILGGNIKAMLPGPSFLSLPSVSFGTSYTVRIPGGECVANGAFLCEGHVFVIAVLEAAPARTSVFDQIDCVTCV